MKLPHALKERPPRCRFTLCQLVTSNESHQNSSLNRAEAPGSGSPPRPVEPTPATVGTLAEHPRPSDRAQFGGGEGEKRPREGTELVAGSGTAVHEGGCSPAPAPVPGEGSDLWRLRRWQVDICSSPLISRLPPPQPTHLPVPPG